MFPERQAKLCFPTFREHRRPGGSGLLAILQNPLVYFGGSQVKCDKPFILGVDHPSEELVSIVQRDYIRQEFNRRGKEEP